MSGMLWKTESSRSSKGPTSVKAFSGEAASTVLAAVTPTVVEAKGGHRRAWSATWDLDLNWRATWAPPLRPAQSHLKKKAAKQVNLDKGLLKKASGWQITETLLTTKLVFSDHEINSLQPRTNQSVTMTRLHKLNPGSVVASTLDPCRLHHIALGTCAKNASIPSPVDGRRAGV